MSDFIFVYGTLRPGLAPPEIAETAAKLRHVSDGFVYGEFYQLDGYPGAVPDETSDNKIAGMILELPSGQNILSQLDAHEGYAPESPHTSEFVRARQTVQLNGGGSLECWMYCYNHRSPEA
jgi:gamma-glutamylcyclotransferase (GGCT)/AIG2-like uncharacterized protein YtfP